MGNAARHFFGDTCPLANAAWSMLTYAQYIKMSSLAEAHYMLMCLQFSCTSYALIWFQRQGCIFAGVMP
jgi:hypothetical protein